MATMTDAQRRATWAKYMRKSIGSWSISKHDLRDAVDAVDQAIEDNEAALNNWFPAAFKASASTKQKAALLAFVLLERYEVL